jgi:hypothetical protein
MKRILLLLALSIFIIGCTHHPERLSQQQQGNTHNNENPIQKENILEQQKENNTPSAEPIKPFIQEGCDGICDNFEKEHHESGCYKPDCLGIPNGQSISQSGTSESVTVTKTDSEYEITSVKPTGWFVNHQNADIVLSGINFNNGGGPLLFNHPGTVATDGVHLILADRNNNRVLIWNTLPKGNIAPDLVLGQKDFTSNNPGTGLDNMNWPVSVSVGSGKLALTDTNNDRILIWNNFPTKNGQPADIVLNSGIINGPDIDIKRSIFWPWGVWTDGEKLAVTSTRNGIILLWNKFPAKNDQPADIYLKGQGNIGTPRTITSDGNHLIVGDHNSKVTSSGATAAQPNSGNFFWGSWPTKDDQMYDFFEGDPSDPGGVWMQGTFTENGKLVMLGEELHIWNSFPISVRDKPASSIGDKTARQDGYHFNGGDGSGMAVAGNVIYISLSNGNKVVGFSSIPSSSDAKPDFAIGSPDINTNTLETNFIMSNPAPATDGKSLFVSSDFDRKLYVYKNLPDESKAYPDFVYSLTDAPWDNALFGSTLALVGKKTVYIWDKLPLNGEMPDSIFIGNIGNIQLEDLKGVAIDGKYFYLSDGLAGRIYVWERTLNDSAPKFIINSDSSGRLSSDGNYLVNIGTDSPSGDYIKIYKISDLPNSKPAVVGKNNEYNLPQYALAYNGHLFVAGTGVNKVFIWKDITDAIAGKDADVILGQPSVSIADPYTLVPEIGQNKLFMPSIIAFDGSYLWIGEFKFSERLLRFSVK